jgi:hypothetical protein
MPNPISSHSSFPIFLPSLSLATPFNLSTQKMSQSNEANHSSATADEIHIANVESAAAATWSESPFSTSSSTRADQAMAKKQIPNLYE